MPGRERFVERFPVLHGHAGLAHAFTLRDPRIETAVERPQALANLAGFHAEVIADLGFESAVTCEQVHGRRVAVVTGAGTTPAARQWGDRRLPGCDGLVTNSSGLLLGIYVADCAAVYLFDPRARAIGLVHSGKRGSELGIVPAAIGLMTGRLGARAEDIVVQIAPCIRPPDYEIDFAAQIRRQCAAAGIAPGNLHDCGASTASDLGRYYSYRLEKGRTGRMLALLAIKR